MFVQIDDIDKRPSRHLLKEILEESLNHFTSARDVSMLVNNSAFYNLAVQKYKAMEPLRRGSFTEQMFNNYQALSELVQQLPIIVETQVRSGAVCAATSVVFRDIENRGK